MWISIKNKIVIEQRKLNIQHAGGTLQFQQNGEGY